MHLFIPKDTHTPGGYRTHGVVMNSKEFADDFKCSKGSPMNLNKKCEVWASPNSKSNSTWIKIESPLIYEEINLQPSKEETPKNLNETVYR